MERLLAARQRALIVAAIAAATLVFGRPLLDVFQLPKIVLVAVAMGVVGILAVRRALLVEAVELPWSPLAATVGAFVVALWLTTAVSGEFVSGVVGPYRRYTGAFAYTMYAGLLLAVLRYFDRQAVRVLLRVIAAAGAVVGSYAVMQGVGADPFEWSGALSDLVFATVGNANFASAVTTIVAVVGLGLLLAPDEPLAGRVLGGGAAILGIAGVVFTRSFQGRVGAAVGIAVLALAWALGRPARQRTWFLTAVGVMAAAGVSVLVAAVAGAGPLASRLQDVGFERRTYYWDAAVSMFRSHPVAGVGPGRYGGHFHEFRSPEAAANLPFEVTSDAAHSVPLEMFATGGMLLGVTYLAVVGITGWVLFQGLVRAGSDRWLLAIAGAGWAAYQVTSLVSIDVPSVAPLHWVLAGAVMVAAGAVGTRRWQLPLAPVARRGGFRRLLVNAVAILAIVAVAWGGIRTLRADAAAHDAEQALLRRLAPEALPAAKRATQLVGWQSEYWETLADAYALAGREESALEALEQALSIDPGEVYRRLNAARLASRLGFVDRAEHHFAELLSRERYEAEPVTAAAAFYLDREEPARAVEILENLLAVEQDATAWDLLAEGLDRIGRGEEAAEARQRARELDEAGP